MGMAKAAPTNVVDTASKTAPASPTNEVSIPTTAVESAKAPAVTKQENKAVEKKVAAKAVAYGRELSEYELQKDRKIGVAGVVQAVIGSDWYSQQAALTDLSSADSVKALREFAKEEVEYWLGVIKAKSE